MFVNGAGDVAVVVVVEGKVPVTPVKPDTVGHDLKFMARTGVGFAVCSCEIVGAGDILFLLKLAPLSHKYRRDDLHPWR